MNCYYEPVFVTLQPDTAVQMASSNHNGLKSLEVRVPFDECHTSSDPPVRVSSSESEGGHAQE